MKRAITLTALAIIFCLLGCASTGKFQKSERVQLILHNGDKNQMLCHTYPTRRNIF